MQQPKKIANALISVFYKDGLEPLAKALNQLGVNIYSTGGTQEFIEKLGIKVNAVEDLTGYPSILGGRVKTLHPKVFGGILARRSNEQDQKEVKEFGKCPECDGTVVEKKTRKGKIFYGCNNFPKCKYATWEKPNVE